MTKTDAYFYRLAMSKPFASGEGAALTPIEKTAGENNSVNFNDGFPAAYSSPHSGGGKYVTRGEMNAIGNLASQNQFYFLAGGINTFDQTFSDEIGGYPKGAVLDYITGNKIYKVMSLIDNNEVDFTEAGVDGVSWTVLNQDNPKYDNDSSYVDVEMGNVVYSGGLFDTTVFSLGSFIAPKNGVIFAAPNSAINRNGTTWNQVQVPTGFQDGYIPLGVTIFIKKVTDSDIDNGITIPSWDSSTGLWTLNGFSTLRLLQGQNGKVYIRRGSDNDIPTTTLDNEIHYPRVELGSRYEVMINLGVWNIVGFDNIFGVNYTASSVTGDIKFRIS